ncbi:hypothetical protein V8G54_033141 [Vigna mungo]|uniref:Uncharacterized protein n=1 Tax=Vigna mungo TaxID=3915 RepID=A0AAQ3RG12_VIGMU
MALYCVVKSLDQTSNTAKITHALGIFVCENLFWMILPHSWRCYFYILNIVLLLLACFFFKDYFIHLIRQEEQESTSQAHHISDLEAQHQELGEIQQNENFDNAELKT